MSDKSSKAELAAKETVREAILRPRKWRLSVLREQERELDGKLCQGLIAPDSRFISREAWATTQ